MHWTGYTVFFSSLLLPLAYLAWRVTWTRQHSSRPGWLLIATVGAAWALVCGWGLLRDPRMEGLLLLACGEGTAGLVALELWSRQRLRQRLQQRLEGRPSLEATMLWCVLLGLSLVPIWVLVGDRIWFVVDRYPGTHYADYGLKVGLALWRGVFLSVLIYGVVGLVRNVVELTRLRRLRAHH